MKRSAITVLTAAVTATSLALVPGAPVAHGATASACTPTSHTLATPGLTQPLVMSPRGHVVTRQMESGIASSWLYRPDGSSVRIAFANGTSPYYVSDVNARGSSVGTLGLNQGAIGGSGSPWFSRGARARPLPTPTAGAPTYFAASINGGGSIAGVAANLPDAMPGDADFEASVVVWPDRASLPVTLAMPAGLVVDVPTSGWPIVDITNAGYVSAILVDPATSTKYLATWAYVTAPLGARALPTDWVPTDVGGGWIVGRIANTGQGFIASPDVFVTISALGDTVGGMRITANHTWMANRYGGTLKGDATLVGRYLTTAHTTERFVTGADVVGTRGGQVAFRTPTPTDVVGVISCALGLPDPTDVSVSAPVRW